MIPKLDISDWNTPYDKGVFDWDKISGGQAKLRARGLAGGSLTGDALGLGEETTESDETVPETRIVGQCDFTGGDTVRAIQEQLGVPVTGVFDEATCAGWLEEFGEPPTARSLEASTDAACASIVVPRCASLDEKRASQLPVGLLAAAAATAAVAGYLIWRQR